MELKYSFKFSDSLTHGICYKSVSKFGDGGTYEKKRKKGPVVFSSLEATD